MAFLVGFILIKGVGNLKPELFALEYNSENASLMPALINTLIITLLSLLIAVPFGIFAAIYLVEYAKKRKQVCKNNSYNNRDIAGNSIYHFWFVWTLFFSTALLHWGYFLLSGAMTLVIMILPLIIRTTEEALIGVPDAYREASFGLGAGKLRTVLRWYFQSAIPGILSGVVCNRPYCW